MPQTDRVLIIEEEALLALDIESILAEHSPVEVTHHRNIAETTARLADLSAVGLALVEAHFGAPEVAEFTQRLVEAGIATVVMSADPPSLDLFPHATPLGKPFDAASLLAACATARSKVTRDAEWT